MFVRGSGAIRQYREDSTRKGNWGGAQAACGAVRRKSGRMPQEITDASISRGRFPRLRFPAERRRKAGPEERAAVCGRAGPADHRPARPRGDLSHESRPGNGEARALRREFEGLRLRGDVQRGIRRGHSRARAGRFRAAQLRIGAIRASDVSHSRVWVGRAEGKMAATPATGKSNRLLRADRAAIRLESRRNADACREKGR